MKIPRADNKLEAFFRSVVPADPDINLRPMFGNLAGFVNGNLFSGLFGHDLFVRLGGKDREELLAERGTRLFEPMEGRPMKEYVCVPAGWLGNAAKTSPWMLKSLEYSRQLHPKERKKKLSEK